MDELHKRIVHSPENMQKTIALRINSKAPRPLIRGLWRWCSRRDSNAQPAD